MEFWKNPIEHDDNKEQYFMTTIECPNCHTSFEVDANSYNSVVHQIKNVEFQKEIQARLEEEQRLYEEKVKSLEKEHKFEQSKAIDRVIADKDEEIQRLKSSLQIAENEIQHKLESLEKDHKSETEKLVSDYERKFEAIRHKDAEDKAQCINKLQEANSQLQHKVENNEQTRALAIAQAIQQKAEEISRKNEEIQRLESNLKIAKSEAQHQLQLLKTQADADQKEAVHQAEDRLKDEHSKELQTLTAKYDDQLKTKNDELERIQNYKNRLSTKMIGESLEQFCETEFNKLRATAFPKVFFEKDNDAKSGSKCDFIFREQTEDGIELISIAFEMKNEAENTAVKHKNEDFFKKLDKDRNEKKCEYAVLVSCLEQDSELYNTGIVDVSYKYPKMYVVRPQFFIPIISLLRNEALNSVRYRYQLVEYQNRNIDVTNFENKLSEVKDQFKTNFDRAQKKFNDAVAEIDKSIEHLEKIKEALLASEKHLEHANNKLQDVTVRKLTYQNPTMQQMFRETKKKTEIVEQTEDIEVPF